MLKVTLKTITLTSKCFTSKPIWIYIVTGYQDGKRHDIAEILLKLMLNINRSINQHSDALLYIDTHKVGDFLTWVLIQYLDSDSLSHIDNQIIVIH